MLINNGVAKVKPLKLALIGGGVIAGEMAIDARTDTPKVHANLQGNDIELKTFFRNSKFFDTTQGKVQGHVNLAGVGRSLAQVMGSADGHVELAHDRRLGLEPDGEPGRPAAVRRADPLCHRRQSHPDSVRGGPHELPAGTVTSIAPLFDTQKSILRVNGQVALKSQVVNVEVKAEPKSFDLLDLHGPVAVTGKIRDPQISLSRVFPIPTPAIGTAKTVNCPALTQQLLGSQAPDVRRAR